MPLICVLYQSLTPASHHAVLRQHMIVKADTPMLEPCVLAAVLAAMPVVSKDENVQARI
jgi:hypothetical protein